VTSYVKDRKKKRDEKKLKKMQRKKARKEIELIQRLQTAQIKQREKRLARSTADTEWKAIKKLHKEKKISKQVWRELKSNRSNEKTLIKQENLVWHQDIQNINSQIPNFSKATPPVSNLYAVLIGIDNKSRKCHCLAPIIGGKNTTAEDVIKQLQTCLPKGLEYILSDNGTPFIAEEFIGLLADKGIVHIRISPYRPQTNGIAERHVRTMKEILSSKKWNSFAELSILLLESIKDYNDRPHQATELSGLSPNEFERRYFVSQLAA
jgi:hypothetical protein